MINIYTICIKYFGLFVFFVNYNGVLSVSPAGSPKRYDNTFLTAEPLQVNSWLS